MHMKRHSCSAIRLVAIALLAMVCVCLAGCGGIHDVAKNGNLENVQMLLKSHPDLVFSKDKNGETALHLAATRTWWQCC